MGSGFDWDAKRAVVELLTSSEFNLVSADRFEQRILRLDLVDCTLSDDGNRDCPDVGNRVFEIRQEKKTQELVLYQDGQSRYHHRLTGQLPFPSEMRFGTAIHILRDRKIDQRTYFIIREIESPVGRPQQPVRQILSFFLWTSETACQIGDAVAGRHNRYYETMTAAIQLIGDTISCDDRLIHL